jgi:hypothetical protein
MSTMDIEALAQITTWEQFKAAFAAGVPLGLLAEHAPVFLRASAERQEIERFAIPLYKADLASIPHYAGWDDRAWSAYLGSRWVQVCERVVAHLAGAPWPPEA